MSKKQNVNTNWYSKTSGALALERLVAGLEVEDRDVAGPADRRERVLAALLARPVHAPIAPFHTDLVAHLDDGAAASLGDVHELQVFVTTPACGGLGNQCLGRDRD